MRKKKKLHQNCESLASSIHKIAGIGRTNNRIGNGMISGSKKETKPSTIRVQCVFHKYNLANSNRSMILQHKRASNKTRKVKRKSLHHLGPVHFSELVGNRIMIQDCNLCCNVSERVTEQEKEKESVIIKEGKNGSLPPCESNTFFRDHNYKYNNDVALHLTRSKLVEKKYLPHHDLDLWRDGQRTMPESFCAHQYWTAHYPFQ